MHETIFMRVSYCNMLDYVFLFILISLNNELDSFVREENLLKTMQKFAIHFEREC